jgi:hypothetical protein
MKTKELIPTNHLNDRMYVYPSFAKQAMTSKQVKETLLATDNFVTAAGRGWKLKVKSLGAGMHEVSLIPFES